VQRLKSALWYSIGQFVDEKTLENDMNATPQFIGALTELVYTQIGKTMVVCHSVCIVLTSAQRTQPATSKSSPNTPAAIQSTRMTCCYSEDVMNNYKACWRRNSRISEQPRADGQTGSQLLAHSRPRQGRSEVDLLVLARARRKPESIWRVRCGYI
jgi:hypothetical protein